MITTNDDLANTCRRWSVAGLIGVDTEFVRERTYHPRPALVQVSNAEEVTFIDPTRVSDFKPLADLLANPTITVVMHACGEDLDVFEVLGGTSPVRVFDTQLAGAFAGYGYSLGYRGLVSTLLGVELEKGETRSEWLRRPLSPAQLHYAELDVLHLLPMHERLSRELDSLGRTRWLEEELQRQRTARAAEALPEAAYRRIKGRGALSASDHSVLRALCAWRETEAMSRDMPRRHLLPDQTLLALAKEPDPAVRLDHISGLSPRARSRYGPALLACIASTRAEAPAENDQRTSLRSHTGTMARLKEVVQRLAKTLELPQELVASRRALESLLITVLQGDTDLPSEFQGWRRDIITGPLLDCLRS